MAPDVIRNYVDDRRDIGDCIKRVRDLSSFESQAQNLHQRLVNPELGYANARRRAASWLREAMADLASAKAHLGGYVDILLPSAQRVERRALNVALDQWWSAHRGRLLALLGAEGMGKTWEVLSWWLDRGGPGGNGLPLTLFVPARDVGSNQPLSIVAEALLGCMGTRDVRFWERRADRWLRLAGTGDVPRILLVIDGLNENQSFSDWSRLFQRCQVDSCRNGVAVAITDRPDDWQDRLRQMIDLTPPSHSVEVPRFNDEEVDELLRLHSLAQRNFEPGLIDLLKIPRLCQLAIRLHRELEDSGDLTRERLVLEEWKDRIQRRSQTIRMDDAEFRRWLAEIGARLQHGLQENRELMITRKELLDDLGRESGASPHVLYGAISEIVDGGWLEATAPHRFRVRPNLAPFALGLALAEQLRLYAGPSVSPDALISEFIDPLRGQDIAVEILRCAVSVATCDSRVPRDTVRALGTAWLLAPNFPVEDFEAFWRLIPLAVEAFCDIAEHIWLRRLGGYLQDQVLIKGLANAYAFGPVRPILERRCSTWLGLYAPDPEAGGRRGLDPDSDAAQQRRAKITGRRAEWDLVAPKFSSAPEIQCRDDGDVGWLSHRTIALLSHLPRRPFVGALRAWAVSRGIWGASLDRDDVAWLLRWNIHDAVEVSAVLVEEAHLLATLGQTAGRRAARLLLGALASPLAEKEAEAQGLAPQSPFISHPRADRVTVSEGVIQWTPDASGQEEPDPPLRALGNLSDYAVDPSLTLPETMGTLLEESATRTDVARLWPGVGVTESDHAVEAAVPALARWRPAALGALLRRVYERAPEREPQALSGLAFALPRSLIVLRGPQVRAIDIALARESVEESTRSHLLAVVLRGQTSDRQLETLLSQGQDLAIQSVAPLLVEPTASDLAAIAGYLDPQESVDRLLRVLQFLLSAGPRQLQSAYSAVARLLRHADTRVRGAVMHLAWLIEDEMLCREIVNLGWAHISTMGREEAIYGSVILCRQATKETAGDISQRIDPQALGYLQETADTNVVRESFATYLRTQVQDLVSGRGPVSFPAFWADDLPETQTAADRVVQERRREVLEWLAPLRQGAGYVPVTEEFPIITLCRSLLKADPESGGALWSSLIKMSDAGGIRFQIPGFETMPFAVDDGPIVAVLREEILRRVRTDKDLSAVALTASEHGSEPWLIQRIEQAVRGTEAGEIAQALTLAAFLDSSPRADSLWSELDSAAPASGWLLQVYRHAREAYDRDTWARHWFAAFLNDRDADTAHGHYCLFLACLDCRALGWGPALAGEARERLPAEMRAHNRLCWPEVRRRVETIDRDRERTLYHTSISSRLQKPWLR
jgi:hypothetical protein